MTTAIENNMNLASTEPASSAVIKKGELENTSLSSIFKFLVVSM